MYADFSQHTILFDILWIRFILIPEMAEGFYLCIDLKSSFASSAGELNTGSVNTVKDAADVVRKILKWWFFPVRTVSRKHTKQGTLIYSSLFYRINFVGLSCIVLLRDVFYCICNRLIVFIQFNCGLGCCYIWTTCPFFAKCDNVICIDWYFCIKFAGKFYEWHN